MLGSLSSLRDTLYFGGHPPKSPLERGTPRASALWTPEWCNVGAREYRNGIACWARFRPFGTRFTFGTIPLNPPLERGTPRAPALWTPEWWNVGAQEYRNGIACWARFRPFGTRFTLGAKLLARSAFILVRFLYFSIWCFYCIVGTHVLDWWC